MLEWGGGEKLPDPELNFAFELKGNENKKRVNFAAVYPASYHFTVIFIF